MPHVTREKQLFDQALDLATPVEREAFVRHECGGDDALRQRVLALLAAHEVTSAFLPEESRRTMLATSAELPNEQPGAVIGRYKLLERVGEGGCGVVYVAEQTEPVRRRVALKVIKLGMDTKQVVARFEAERQALAMMDHPNIAKVLDAGATELGRPYFVMELVRGIPITQYCDQNNLSTTTRLDLFIKVCQAIQHAHQKGIIHRDIKPSNILVTVNDGMPVPKVIDFGIAKATEGRLTDHTVYTQLHQFIGTPAYMSPEQAEMTSLDIDTRSDIYSLGVLLYELLAGRTPFDAKELMAAGLDAMRRTIREQEPARPSTKLASMQGQELSTTAKRRSTEAPKLLRQLQGDLDWIVMKCLEKDRTRRYETANGLAADLTRHLTNEPVIARPPSAGYRFQKAFRRNRLAFAAVAAVALALIAGLAASSWQAAVARRQQRAAELARGEADVARRDAEAVTVFLGGVFASPDPARDGRAITVAESLDRAAQKLEKDLADQPLRRAKLQEVIGRTYQALGLSKQAIPLLEKSRDYRLGQFGLEHPDTLQTLSALATAYDAIGRWQEARQLREQILELRRKVSGPEHSDTLGAMHDLARSPSTFEQRQEVTMLMESVLELRRKVNGPEHPETLRAMFDLARISRGGNDQAIKRFEEILELERKVNGVEHPDTLQVISHLAFAYQAAGRLDQAIQLHEQAVELHRKVNGPEHRNTVEAMSKMKPFPSDEKNPLTDGAGRDELVLWLAYREARALLNVVSAER